MDLRGPEEFFGSMKIMCFKQTHNQGFAQVVLDSVQALTGNVSTKKPLKGSKTKAN